MDNKIQLKKLGLSIHAIRSIRRETIKSMSYKLGYSDVSSYAKIERGDYDSIDFNKLLLICDILEISLYNLCKLADLDLMMHKNSIISWDQFYTSICNNSDSEIIRLLSLIDNSTKNDTSLQ